MNSFTFVLALSALASSAVARPAPSSQATTRKGFTFEQSVPKPFQSGPQRLQQTYLKYNSAVPPAVKAAAESGSVTANPEQFDEEYLCPVSVGGQTLNLDFDTGSADL